MAQLIGRVAIPVAEIVAADTPCFNAWFFGRKLAAQAQVEELKREAGNWMLESGADWDGSPYVKVFREVD